MLPSCALLGGFAIGARVALLWRHNANAKCQRVHISVAAAQQQHSMSLGTGLMLAETVAQTDGQTLPIFMYRSSGLTTTEQQKNQHTKSCAATDYNP